MRVRLDAQTERLVNRLARETKRTKSEVVREAITALARFDAESTGARRPYEAIAHLLGCDLADAALVCVAERERRRRIFTPDRRDFQVYRPLRLGRFAIIPP